MALQPFSDEQLNFFKFATLVLDEFPKALRQTFKTMWDNTYGHRPGFQLWDDSTAVRNMFDSEEAKSGKKTKVPVTQSYNEWDCTSLFQATIFARSFTLPASTGSYTTLNDLYVKPCAVSYGSFHTCVASPGGNMAETSALAIDQLRLLRNSLFHSTSSEMDKATFDRGVNYAKDAFRALGVSTASIDAVGSLTESDFPTNEVRQLERRIIEESRAYIKFLEEMSSDVIEIRAMLNAIMQQVDNIATKEDIAMLKQKIAKLQDESNAKLKTTGRLPMLIDCEGTVPQSQDVLNVVALKYLSKLDPSTQEEFNEFIEYMEKVRKVIIVDAQSGSLILILECSSLQILDELWEDYCTGHLSEMAQYLVTEEILREFGLAEIKLKITIKEEEYRACRELLSSNIIDILGVDRGAEGQHSDASKDAPQLGVKLPRMSDIQVPTKLRNHARLPVDILLLTVKDCEFSACYMNLNNPFKCWFDDVGFVYFEDENEGEEEKVKVALLRCHEGSSGPGGSIVTTKNAVSMLMPKAVILVGSCSSLCPEETKLGDVVISAKLTTYGLKVVTNERELHNNIRTFASKRFLDVIKDAAFGWEAPLKNSEDREVKIHSSGELLSVPEVINAESRRKQLAEAFPQAVAIDSEAEGLYTAAFDLQVEWLVVKGIANYADGNLNTNENWSEFASANAASLVAKILNDAVVFQRWPHYQGNEDHVNKGVRPSLSLPSLPTMVPNFTGRQSECQEIAGHVTSESTRLVSIWGSPGFGKTSVAIAVGHDLQSQGMPVCWLSLRELKSKTDLTSKLLSFLKPSVRNDHPSMSYPSLDDQLCLLLSEISDRSIFILDNADNLLEDGEPGVKKEVIELLKEILRRSKATIFALTTRESLRFLNVDLQGYQSVRIRPLDEESAKTLVEALLPAASSSDCTRILQICGLVPLAIKLLCSSISEDEAEPSQYLDEFMQFASTASIAEMLDRPDYPDEYRLQSLFELSFKRLTSQEKKAFVSLSILPENFGTEVAAAVFDENNVQTKKVLHSLQRKSLLDSGLQQEFFTMHKLIQTFAREKGQTDEMKDTVLKSKHRLNNFYVSLFKKLNQQYLTGHSMEAFLTFCKDEQSIIQSLLECLSDSITAPEIFEVLAKAELFVDNLDYLKGSTFHFIYDSAIQATRRFEKNEYYSRLLVSKAFAEACWGVEGSTAQLAKEVSPLPSVCLSELQGKRLCYLGIRHLASGKTDDGVQVLREAVQLKYESPDFTVLRLVALQILGTYSQVQNNVVDLNQLLYNAEKECKRIGDPNLLLISSGKCKDRKTELEEKQTESHILSNHPLKWQVLTLVTKATKNFMDYDTKNHLRNILHKMLKDIETQQHVSIGHFRFYRNVITLLPKSKDTKMLLERRIDYHQTALNRCSEMSSVYHVHRKALAEYYMDLGMLLFRFALTPRQKALGLPSSLDEEENESPESGNHNFDSTQNSLGDFNAALDSFQHALEIHLKLFGEEHASTADNYHHLGTTQHSLGDFTAALNSKQHALEISRKLFGEENATTANSYQSLGITQHSLGNFHAALDSEQHALDILLKLLGEEHADTARIYQNLGVTQHSLGEFSAALKSKQHALDIRRKLFENEHPCTAESYHTLATTQFSLGDLNAALYSEQHTLDIHLKLFGEGHADTAIIYQNLGITQHSLGDFSAALKSKGRALDIRLRLFGEEHVDTASSFHTLGVTQHSLGNFSEALKSKRRALDIRLKFFGEQHADTAHSYHELGATQHLLGDNNAALDSHQHALDIRRKLFGEEHADTIDSYHSLGHIQHTLGDLKSALNSNQTALNICLKVFGEDHARTACFYHTLGANQYFLRDFSAALDSEQHALNIRQKLFGEDHADTADSYFGIGVTQLSLGNFTAALDSNQQALGIRRKLFGEGHARTADSYHNLGATQHSLGHLNAARGSFQNALDIRLKLFGEEHTSTADSYHMLGSIHHSSGDLHAALGFKQHALDIRLKLFGEEHASTADSYNNLGTTQHSLGDLHAALVSKRHALDINLQLFGEEHATTADSYKKLGVIQHLIRDFTAALCSYQHELDIRLKLFGENNASTADSYHNLGSIQLLLGDFHAALCSYQHTLHIRLQLFGEEHTSTADSYNNLGSIQLLLGDFHAALCSYQHALGIRLQLFGEEHVSTADSYHKLGVTQHSIRDFAAALCSYQHALNIRLHLFGENHASTAVSYINLGTTHHSLGDLHAALVSQQHALDISLQLFGEEHASTADSYNNLGATQLSLGDFNAALDSKQHVLDIRLKLIGEEHASTADSYDNLGEIQLLLDDFHEALCSYQHALDIRLKLFGEKHASTAESYSNLGATQVSLGLFHEALGSFQHALDIRRKLFGEEHADTAHSYHKVGATQHSLGDNNAALDSHQRALDIRRKLSGEENPDTLDSYHNLGHIQHALGDNNAALDSHQHELGICLKLSGEEHARTAGIYHTLGVTQYLLQDFSAALDSEQHALDIRLKLFGKDHTSTADSYNGLGVIQDSLGDLTAALDSVQHALVIRRKLLGEENESTADSYYNLGAIQHSLGDSNAALDSKQHALDIRLKLFGEEHSCTADSYHGLGVIQHSLGDFTAALDSEQHALDIRLKLFGENHASTAESYHKLGITQHSLGDFNAALDSLQQALDICLKLFGEDHARTADSYHGISVTLHSLGDFKAAQDFKQRALEIRRKLSGEKYTSNADSYNILGATRLLLGDFHVTLGSYQHALLILIVAVVAFAFLKIYLEP